MDNKLATANNFTTKPEARKLFVVILLVIVVVLAISIRIWFLNLKMPFITPEDQRVALNSLGSGTNNPSTNDETLKKTDSDADGLTDYDELNIYHTSPYVVDSDSDGLADGEEVKKGTNPNCPTGQDCSGQAVAVGENAVVTPAQIREYLAKNGMSAEQVSALDDKTLMDAYQSALASNNTQLPSITGNLTAESLKNLPGFLSQMSGLSIADIRAGLIKQGYPKDQLDKVTDEQLKQAWLETIQKSVVDSKALEQINNNNAGQ